MWSPLLRRHFYEHLLLSILLYTMHTIIQLTMGVNIQMLYKYSIEIVYISKKTVKKFQLIY